MFSKVSRIATLSTRVVCTQIGRKWQSQLAKILTESHLTSGGFNRLKTNYIGSVRELSYIHQGAPLDVPDESFHTFLFRHMEQHPDATCLIDKSDGATYTFGDVISLSKSISAGLKDIGMSPGDIIMFYKTNSADFITTMLATSMTGGVTCSVNPASTPYELKRYIPQVKPRFIFTEAALLPNMMEACKETNYNPQIIASDKTSDKSIIDLDTLKTTRPTLDADSDVVTNPKADPCVIIFSSGTTGFPKGVVLSHRNLVHNMLVYGPYFPDQQIMLSAFPIYHSGGLILGAMRGLTKGMVQVMYPTFDVVQFLEGIQKYKPNSAILPPPLIVLMTKSPLVDQYDISSLTHVLAGSAPLKRALEEEFNQKFKHISLCQGYGLSEMTAGVIGNQYQEGVPVAKPGSVGKPVPGTEVKIINRDTREILGPNTNGEITARSPSVMLGYLNDPDSTKTVLDSDGWIHTGDVGYYDEDGYFYIVDRYKELIKYKGYQVAPAELDDIILNHPDVTDAAVIGLPDEVAGELPCAFVVKKPGSNVTEQDIIKFVSERAAYYKHLRGGVRFTDAIPKLPTGKILRRVLRETAIK